MDDKDTGIFIIHLFYVKGTFFRPSKMPLSAMVATAVFPTAMMAAVMPFSLMVMVAALDVRVIAQAPIQQGMHSIIRAAAYPAIELYSGFGQRILCAKPDASADERIHTRTL